jgi:uncharacterized protein YodC (DUF2158 family)
MIAMIRVRAKGDGRCPHVSADGKLTRRRRWVGRKHDGPNGALGGPLKNGELVPDITFYQRRIAQGALEIVDAKEVDETVDELAEPTEPAATPADAATAPAAEADESCGLKVGDVVTFKGGSKMTVEQLGHGIAACAWFEAETHRQGMFKASALTLVPSATPADAPAGETPAATDPASDAPADNTTPTTKDGE